MAQIDFYPVVLSMITALQALCFVVLVSVPLALYAVRTDFAGKEFVESIIALPLVLPPVVTGFVLLLLLGKNGVIGRMLSESWGIQIVFTPIAAVIAATVIAFPLMYQSAKAAFQSLDTSLEDVARTLGASETRLFFTVTLPLAWPGLAAGMVLAYARALGEFGATVMLAGNIPGKTQTIPTAIYFSSEANDLMAAGSYVVIICILTFTMIYGANLWSKKHLEIISPKPNSSK